MRTLVNALGHALLALTMLGPDLSSQQVEAVQERMPAILETLADVGYDLGENVPVVVLESSAEAGAYFVRQGELLFVEGHLTGMTALVGALHGDRSLDADFLDDLPPESLGEPIAAYYDLERSALVLVDEQWSELTGHDGLVAHELAHACRDETHPLLEFLAPAPESVDSAMVRKCVIEGDAELARIAFSNHRRGSSLDGVSEHQYDLSSARTRSNDWLLSAYEAGGRLALRQHQLGGLATIDRLFESPPASTEQVLHAEKADDVPTPLPLPGTPAPVVYETTLGELFIRGLLRDLSGSVLEGTRAAIGWDGDSLRVLRTPDGGLAVQWRTLWDRELDARQFALLIGNHQKGEGTLRRHGRLVDWVAADDEERRAQLVASLADALPVLEPDEHGARSAEAVEARFDSTPYVAGGDWLHPGSGLRIPIPEDCVARILNDTHALMWPPVDGFVDTVRLQRGSLSTPLPAATLAERFAENIDGQPTLTVTHKGTREVHGREVADVTFTGGAAPRQETVRAIGIPREDHTIWIAITILSQRVESRREAVEDLLDGILLDD